MRKIVVVLLVLLCMFSLSAKKTGKADAVNSGLYEAVDRNYSLFGGIDPSSVDYGFEMTCDTNPAHPVAWRIDGALFYGGILFVQLPEDVNAEEVVVTVEDGRTFTSLHVYTLSEHIMMLILEDEHDEITIIRKESKYGGVKLSHVHTEDDYDGEMPVSASPFLTDDYEEAAVSALADEDGPAAIELIPVTEEVPADEVADV